MEEIKHRGEVQDFNDADADGRRQDPGGTQGERRELMRRNKKRG